MLAVRRLIPFLLLGPFVLGSSAPHVQVVLSGDVHVRRGEVSRDVVVVHGSADVDGTVQGSVVVFDGPVTVAGIVRGDVAALDGTVTLLRGSHVTGDVWVGRGGAVVQVGSAIDGSLHTGGLLRLAAPSLQANTDSRRTTSATGEVV